jgi:hypothetical protein
MSGDRQRQNVALNDQNVNITTSTVIENIPTTWHHCSYEEPYRKGSQ